MFKNIRDRYVIWRRRRKYGVVEGDPGTITHMEAVADRYFAELLPLEDDIMEHSVFDDELDAEEAEEARRDKELDAYEALANALDNFGRHQR